MNTLPTFFSDFLKEIRPTTAQKDDYKQGHRILRERLSGFEGLKPYIISTFLQGSYRRATAVRPKDGSRSDVDVVVVTNIDSSTTKPKAAMDMFIPFLEKYYAGSWETNDRSFSINLSKVKLDLVITAAPNPEDVAFLKSAALAEDNDVEEMADVVTKSATGAAWKAHPLLIPDRSVSEWNETDPIAQIEWTWEKNRSTNKHYVNVVKSLKWWRKECHPTPEYPKGYPLEHLIGQCCPDGIGSIAEGITMALEEASSRYSYDAKNGTVPRLPDHGVPSHDVMKRVTPKEFSEFHAQVAAAAKIARAALEEPSKIVATEKWRSLLGDKFRVAEKDVQSGTGGLTPRTDPTTLVGGRYA